MLLFSPPPSRAINILLGKALASIRFQWWLEGRYSGCIWNWSLLTVFASKIIWAISRDKPGGRCRHPPGSMLELCWKELAESCRAAQSGQESWEAALLLAGSGAMESPGCHTLQVTVSNSECQRQHGKAWNCSQGQNLAQLQPLQSQGCYLCQDLFSPRFAAEQSQEYFCQQQGLHFQEMPWVQYCRKAKVVISKNVSYPHAQIDALPNFSGAVGFSPFTHFCEIHYSKFWTRGQQFQYPYCK